MAGAKEIRTKIKSINNTKKITRAMEMVAASKMRRAQDRMKASRPYAEKMLNVIHHLAYAHPEYKHPYLMSRTVQAGVGYIIISSDRGLCGGLNINLFRALLTEMKTHSHQKMPIKMCLFGAKSLGFFKRLGSEITCQTTHLGDTPHIKDLIGSVRVMLDAYQAGQIDRLYIAHNQFVNTMTQTPRIAQLLPIQADLADKEAQALKHHWDYIYEPDSKEVLESLLMRYIESLVYQGVVENIACEQAARMVAMKSASDNAGKIIDELKLVYNKVRQAAITQEISEIVGGAAAV